MLTRIQNIHRYNLRQISDKESLSDELKQKICVSQSDKLSTLLFTLFIADLGHELKRDCLQVNFFAVHLVLASRSHSYLQQQF